MAMQTVPGYPQYSGNAIPVIYAAKRIVNFHEIALVPQIANTDYQGSISREGDSVVIRGMPTTNIREYIVGIRMAEDTLEVPHQTLLINQAQYFNFILDERHSAPDGRELLGRLDFRGQLGHEDGHRQQGSRGDAGRCRRGQQGHQRRAAYPQVQPGIVCRSRLADQGERGPVHHPMRRNSSRGQRAGPVVDGDPACGARRDLGVGPQGRLGDWRYAVDLAYRASRHDRGSSPSTSRT